jgi:lysophospholipase L1-like esterase
MKNINETFIIEPKILTDSSELTPVVLQINGVSADTEGNVVLTKDNLDLGNINNTSDLDKPVSTATQAVINSVAAGIGNVSPSDSPLSGISTYNVSQAGTYTNFSGIIITTGDTSSGLVQLRKINGTWTKVIIPINLASYATKTDVDNKFVEVIGQATVDTLISEPLPINSAIDTYKTDIFSGWGWPIGNPKNFNKITLKIGARQNITLIKTVIKTVNKTGTTIANKDVVVNMASGDTQLVTVLFDTVIANTNGDQLFLMYAANGFITEWGIQNSQNPYPYPSYPTCCYTTNGNQNFSISWNDIANPSVSSLFLYTKIELETYTIVPSIDFAEKVITSSSTIQSNTTAIASNASNLATINANINTVFTVGPFESNIYESFPESSAVFESLSTTFSGWGTPIGKPTNFNTIKFRVEPMTGSANPITKVRYWIVQDNPTGSTLATGYITGLSITSGTSQYITATLSTTVLNSSNSNIWFFWKADQVANRYGTLGVYLSSIYGANRYTTTPQNIDTISPSTFTIASGGDRNEWVQTSLVSPSTFPTDSFSNKIIAKIPATTPTPLPNLITAEVIWPSRVFAVEGKETNIYFADIINSNVKNSLLDFDIICTKGIQYEKFYRVTPVLADVGSYSLEIDVYFAGQLITSGTTTLYIVAANAASGTSRSILGVGDSTLANGQPLSIILSEHSADVMSLTFKGTQGSGANKHEGHSGWQISDFATQGRINYHFIVSGVTVAPTISSYYSVNGLTFYVTMISITNGNGYVEGFVTSGGGTPLVSGTITKVNGSGDVSISYSSFTTNYLNPFWNGSTSSLDFANYLSTNSIALSSNDWVFIHLGINDVFGQTNDTNLANVINTMVSNLRTLITNMKSAVNGLRIGLCTTIMPTISQDGFGHDYNAGQTLARYTKNIKTWQKRLISEFDNNTERTAGNYLIPWNVIIDRENNMLQSTINANARNTTQITTYTNSVHPAQSGYDQMGDQLFAFLKYMQ